MKFKYSGKLRTNNIREMENHVCSLAARNEWGSKLVRFSVREGNLIEVEDNGEFKKTDAKGQKYEGVVILADYFSDFLWFVFNTKTGELVSGDFQKLVYLNKDQPVDIDLMPEVVTQTSLAGTKIHLQTGTLLKDVFRRFIDGEIISDTDDFTEKDLDREVFETLENYKDIYLAKEGTYGEFSLAGFDFLFDEDRGENELSEDMNYELSKAIEITALGLSAGALPKEPGGEEAEKVEDLVIGFESRPEEDKQEELEFIAAVGAYWGECLIRRFEGKWTEHDEDGVSIVNLGLTGLHIDPFDLVKQRLLWKEPMSIPNQEALFDKWIERLNNWKESENG